MGAGKAEKMVLVPLAVLVCAHSLLIYNPHESTDLTISYNAKQNIDILLNECTNLVYHVYECNIYFRPCIELYLTQ